MVVLKKDEKNGEKIGEARGRKAGEEHGKKIGEEYGRKNGIREATQKIAREMISKNMKIEDIIGVTGLTKEEIAKLKKEEN